MASHATYSNSGRGANQNGNKTNGDTQNVNINKFTTEMNTAQNGIQNGTQNGTQNGAQTGNVKDGEAKQFNCPICSKSFNDPTILTFHMASARKFT